MKLEEILESWSKDSKIDNTELDKESLKIPSLHNKYLKMYTSENLLLRKMMQNQSPTVMAMHPRIHVTSMLRMPPQVDPLY